jgi:hypothetical protein
MSQSQKDLSGSFGWGDATQTNSWKNSAFNPGVINSRIAAQEAYNQSPLSTVTSFISKVSPFVGMVNPALGGLLGLGSMAADAANRASYGASQNTTGLGGAAGGMLGGMMAGPMGGLIGRSLGTGIGASLGGSDGMSAGGNAFGTGVAGTLGGFLGGPIGSKIGSELMGAALSNQAINAANQRSSEMMGRADPFGAQRAAYGGQLNNLMSNPNGILNNPAYKAQYDLALQQATRAAAAEGKLGSGSRVAALGKVAGQTASQAYNQEANRLAGLAGANLSNPAAIQQALAAQAEAQALKQRQLMGLYGALKDTWGD